MSAHADDDLSLAWRCQSCGRIHLALERQAAPAACTDCEGSGFRAISPSASAREVYREAADPLPSPLPEAPAGRPDASNES